MDSTFIVLDVETANNNRHSICQLGITFVQNLELVKSISIYLNPDVEFSKMSIQIHGIQPSHVQSSPGFLEKYYQLKQILEKYPVYQQSRYDEQCINAACDRYGLDRLNINWKNAINVFEDYWPEQSVNGYSLKALCNKFEIDFVHHDAGEDSRITAALLILGRTGEFVLPKTEVTPIPSLEKKVIVFTGNFSKPKNQMERVARGVGMITKNNVNRSTSFVCIGKADH